MILTLDFETEAIDNRPNYPPRPVGIALKIDDADPKYFAFGHPTGNNCEEEFIVGVVRSLIEQADVILMHNAAFDGAILVEKWNLPLDWGKVRCTMIQAFIDDPYSELGLKPLAERLLCLPPEERDNVREWLVKNHVVAANNKKWGAFIAYAPGDVVAPYAEGDVTRTYHLYQYFSGTLSMNQLDAYRREMDLLPIVYNMERRGVNIDKELLRGDIKIHEQHLVDLDASICKILGCMVCVDQDAALADAIEAAGLSKGFASTPTGKRSVAKESLLGAVADPHLLGMLLERAAVATCIRTFMLPWMAQVEAHGRLYVKWNQVRNYSDTGARTGRLSSSPNLQNCLEGDAEVLTPAGWVRLDALPDVCLVAQYDCGEISFVQPSRVIRQDYTGELLEFSSRNHTLSYTPDHRVLVKPFGAADFEDRTAEMITSSTDWVLPVAGDYYGGTGVFSDLDVAKLFVAIRADGSVKPSSIEFGFKRPEKMQRLRELLTKLGITWNEHVSTNGANYFNLHAHPVLAELRQFSSKHYAAWVLNLSVEERNAMLDEELYWDGHAIGDRIRVDSSVPADCYWLQIMAVLSSRACSTAKTTFGEYVSYTKKAQPTLGFRPGPKTFCRKPWNDKVYCVTVPSSYFLVRRKNCVHITGNCPTEWESLMAQFAKLDYVPTIAMPQIRKYIIPDEGMEFVSADYGAQELRLLAHFSGGRLLDALQLDPDADLHMIAANIAGISRKVAKTLAFAILYGAGVARIAEQLHITVEEATRVKMKYLQALPEIKAFQDVVQRRGASRSYVTTLGGREYYSEHPKVVNGRYRTFDYKLVNYLIQGSAADQIKQAMINFVHNRPPSDKAQLVLSVHDQLVVQCPIAHVAKESARLKRAMNSSFQNILDYTVVSDISHGRNFAEV
jgi:DNA polymerase I-like protein with 3'-5' exonuclease and polymerase domains